jgi:hypothetical protein
VTTKNLRKSTLALILALLTAGLGKAFVQAAPPVPVPAHPTLEATDPGGTDPDPCENGDCVVGIHLA